MAEIKTLNALSKILFVCGGTAALLAFLLWRKFKVRQILKDFLYRQKQRRHFGAAFVLLLILCGIAAGASHSASAEEITDTEPPEITLTFEPDEADYENCFRKERIARLTIKEEQGGLSEEKVRADLAACISARDSRGVPVEFDAEKNIIFQEWQPLAEQNEESNAQKAADQSDGNEGQPEENKNRPDQAPEGVGNGTDQTPEGAGNETEPGQEGEERKEGAYTVRVTFTDDAVYSWYPKVTDKAGNSSTEVKAEGQTAPFDFVIDRTAPDLELRKGSPEGSGTEAAIVIGGTPVYKSDVAISVSVKEENARTFSGIRRVSYRVWDRERKSQEGTLFTADADRDSQTAQAPLGQWSGSFTVDSSCSNSNDVRVEVEAEDRAGNVTRSELRFGIDVTAPKITVSYDRNNPANGRYYSRARKAVITVAERNFDPDLFRLNLSNAYGNVPSLSPWKEIGKENDDVPEVKNDVPAENVNLPAENAEDGGPEGTDWDTGRNNGDDRLYQAELIFEEDGDYTLDAFCTDQAGNQSGPVSFEEGTQNSREFVIDRTSPQIRVSYDRNDPANGYFFREARQAEIRVLERNFAPGLFESGLQAKLDGTDIEMPQIIWYRGTDPQLHTGRIVFERDGDYSLSIQDVDLAGNSSTQTDYGDSKAPQAFTIDRTIEQPAIDGAADRTSYRGDLSLQVTFKDRHYDGGQISLIKRERDGSTADVSGTFLEQKEESGTGMICRSIPFGKLKENDGIYFFKCAFSDKAGNRLDSELAFCVNRFGSVYVYDDYLNELTKNGGAYVRKLKENLIIKEYNADPLVPDSLRSEITCDGRPLQDPAFTAKKQEGERFGSWSEYIWTLAEKNFEQDGFYKIMVTSGDAAGNLEDSTMSGLPEIRFHIDSTPPELLSVTGMEKAEVRTVSQPVTFLAYDAQGLEGIRVLADGEEIETDRTEEDGPSYCRVSFSLSASGKPRHVRIVMRDLAGNITDTDGRNFQGMTGFEPDILVKADPVTKAAAKVFSKGGSGQEEQTDPQAGGEEGKTRMPPGSPSFSGLLWMAVLSAAAAAFLILLLVRQKSKKKRRSGNNRI